MEFAARRTAHAHKRDQYRVIVRSDRQATSRFKIMRTAPRNVTRGVIRFLGMARVRVFWVAQAASLCYPASKTRYPSGLSESTVTCSCIAGSLRRRCKSCTICSTKAACGRAKTNKYLGPFPAAGKMTRFSERNFGSRATFDPSRSIARVNGRPAFRATKIIRFGSSLVATSAPDNAPAPSANAWHRPCDRFA